MATLKTPERSTAEVALLGGMHTDCLSYAFALGYQCALQSLAQSQKALQYLHFPCALCITEKTRPPHPKSILCEVTPSGVISGHKSFVTCGDSAMTLLVIARCTVNTQRLKAVAVNASAEGVAMQRLPPLPFCSEISHSSVTFTSAQGTLLPGDGYTNYMRAFRSVEDVHVAASLCGLFLRIARQETGVETATAARVGMVAAAVLEAAREIHSPSHDDVSEHSTNLVLSGISAEVEQVGLTLCKEVLRTNLFLGEKMEKDMILLRVGKTVRDTRLKRASMILLGTKEHSQ